MDIFRFIKQNYKEIVLSSTLLYSNIVIVKQLMLRKSYLKRSQEIEEKKIISMEEAVQISKTLRSSYNSGKSYLIKAYPSTQRNKVVIMKKLPSNQLWLLEPSLDRIVYDFAELFNRCFIEKNKKFVQKMQQQTTWHTPYWQAEYKHGSSEELARVEGFGEIVDHEIFDVKWKYYEKESRGIISRILEGVAFIFQFLFFQNTELSLPKNENLSINKFRLPLIKGPVIGHVFYLLNFLRDRPILLEARIQDDSIVAVSVAGSKQKILQSLNFKILNLNFTISFFLVVSFLSFRYLSPTLSKLAKKIKKWLKTQLKQQKIREKEPHKFNGNLEQMQEKRLCIICYTNCRNTLILNCRHMIMCDECKDVYTNQNCPLCKNKIQEHKIFYEY